MRHFFGANSSPLSKFSAREWVGPRFASVPTFVTFYASLFNEGRLVGVFRPGDGESRPVAPPQNNRGIFPGTHTN